MTLAFDPEDHDYGPASPAVRRILRDWGSIDWFAPTGIADDELIRLFTLHNASAHRLAPDRFAARISTRVELGGWREFIAWCTRVRTHSTWDWKYGGLKVMSHAHSQAHGWTIEREAVRVPPRVDRPGVLFVRIDDGTTGAPMMFWNTPALTRQPTDRIVDEDQKACARFYLEYAHHDLFHAIEWELAAPEEGSDNPFALLLACYRAGAYPFSLARDEYVLFRFAADERALPPARLR